MTCILKTCAHEKAARCASLARAGMGECGAAHALDLASQNQGYLVIARDNPTIDALQNAGLITTKPAGDGCLVARAVNFPTTFPKRNRRGRWSRPVAQPLEAAE